MIYINDSTEIDVCMLFVLSLFVPLSDSLNIFIFILL